MARPLVNGKPMSNGQIAVSIIAALLLLGMVANMLGINTTSSAYCSSTKSDISAGRANSAAAERYYRDCK